MKHFSRLDASSFENFFLALSERCAGDFLSFCLEVFSIFHLQQLKFENAIEPFPAPENFSLAIPTKPFQS